MQTVADDGGDVRLDVAERIDADAREDAEALTLQVLEALAGLVPVVAVGTPAVRIEEHVGGSDQAADLVRPALGVVDDGLQRLVRQTDVAPGVTAEGPAGLLEPRDHGLDRFDLRRAVGLERCALGAVLGDVTVILRAVAEDAVVAGQ